MMPSSSVCPIWSSEKWWYAKRLLDFFLLDVTPSCQPGRMTGGNSSPVVGQYMSVKYDKKISQLSNVEWKITLSFALGMHFALTAFRGVPANSPASQVFTGCLQFSSQTKSHVVLPGFKTSSLVYRMSVYDWFCIFEISLSFSSSLMINEEKKRYFHISAAEYSGIHLYKWHFMSVTKTGVKLGLRLFWRMKHITITT